MESKSAFVFSYCINKISTEDDWVISVSCSSLTLVVTYNIVPSHLACSVSFSEVNILNTIIFIPFHYQLFLYNEYLLVTWWSWIGYIAHWDNCWDSSSGLGSTQCVHNEIVKWHLYLWNCNKCPCLQDLLDSTDQHYQHNTSAFNSRRREWYIIHYTFYCNYSSNCNAHFIFNYWITGRSKIIMISVG